jgi:hypothetical protein
MDPHLIDRPTNVEQSLGGKQALPALDGLDAVTGREL